MKECRNCINCGAPLHYDETNYGRMAKCEYCKTEYHIDKLGRVEEYKVSLKIQNRIFDFYIGSIEIKSLDANDYRTIDGNMHIARNSIPELELNLISYNTRDIESERN